jgi:hypothetical protein
MKIQVFTGLNFVMFTKTELKTCLTLRLLHYFLFKCPPLLHYFCKIICIEKEFSKQCISVISYPFDVKLI